MPKLQALIDDPAISCHRGSGKQTQTSKQARNERATQQRANRKAQYSNTGQHALARERKQAIQSSSQTAQAVHL